MFTTSGISGDNSTNDVVNKRILDTNVPNVDIASNDAIDCVINNGDCDISSYDETTQITTERINTKFVREPTVFTFPSPRSEHIGLYGKLRQKIPATEDFKIMCRLIGLHTRTDVRPGSELTLGQRHESFTIIDSICIGNNVKCLILEETIEQYKRRITRDMQHSLKQQSISSQSELDKFRQILSTFRSNGIHTIFAFNWFSPPSLFSYLNLGSELLFRTGLDARYNRLLGRVYLQKADDFLWNPQMRSYLQNPQFTPNAPNPVRKLTLTGFSLGAAISHALAFLLKEHEAITCGVRVIGFGSPRVGSEAFTQWFGKNLDFDSHNIILTSTPTHTFPSDKETQLLSSPEQEEQTAIEFDPVTLTPSIQDGFDYHPAILLLDQFGLLRPLNDEDYPPNLQHNSSNNTSSSPWYSVILRRIGLAYDSETWAKLHSLTKYYQAMLSYTS